MLLILIIVQIRSIHELPAFCFNNNCVHDWTLGVMETAQCSSQSIPYAQTDEYSPYCEETSKNLNQGWKPPAWNKTSYCSFILYFQTAWDTDTFVITSLVFYALLITEEPQWVSTSIPYCCKVIKVPPKIKEEHLNSPATVFSAVGMYCSPHISCF